MIQLALQASIERRGHFPNVLHRLKDKGGHRSQVSLQYRDVNGRTRFAWQRELNSASFSAEISVRSPQNLSIFIIYTKHFQHRSKPNMFYLYLISENRSTGVGPHACCSAGDSTQLPYIPVLPFSKLNNFIFGYFDPENVFFR